MAVTERAGEAIPLRDRWRPSPILLLIAGLVVMATATGAVLASAEPPAGRPVGPIGWCMLALAFAATEVLVVHVHVRGDSHSLSLSEIPLVIGLFLATPLVLVTANLAGVAGTLILHRGQRGSKLMFNLAKVVLEVGAAVAVLSLAGVDGRVPSNGDILVTFVATGACALLGGVLVSTAIGVSVGSWTDLGFWSTLPISLFGTTTATSLGLMAVILLDAAPATAWLLLVPIVGCLAAYAVWNHQARRLESLGFLYRTAQVLQDYRSIDDAIVALLAETRELLKASSVELLYRGAVDGEATHAKFAADLGGEVASCASSEVDVLISAVGSDPAATLVPVTDDPNLLRRFGTHGGTCIVAPLTIDDTTIGVMLVGPPLSDVAQFGDDERRLVETTARALSVSIENGALEHSLAQFRVLEQRLSHQARHDPLTALANRSGLFEAVARRSETSPDAQIAVLFIDLDDFKQVNDTLGHRVGDQMLVEVATRLRDCVRGTDTAARLGGDEFAVLVAPLDDLHTAIALAQRILLALAAPVILGAQAVPLSASIGIAAGEGGTSILELLDAADAAMYRAKTAGKGRVVVFSPEALGADESDRSAGNGSNVPSRLPIPPPKDTMHPGEVGMPATR